MLTPPNKRAPRHENKPSQQFSPEIKVFQPLIVEEENNL